MPLLPPLFTQRIREQFPQDAEDMLSAYQMAPHTSLRLHAQRNYTQRALWMNEESIPWVNEGYWLAERPVFSLDPAFHGGAYYVQESSSMLLQWVLREVFQDDRPRLALDACAAPGGKSTILSDFIGDSGVVVANELNRQRAQVLREVLIKWGVSNTVITSGSAQSFSDMSEPFDLMVIDAPCSGEGLFRKDPASVDEWSPESVLGCALRQREILQTTLGGLAENGILVYSTCTLSMEENEQVVEWLIREQHMEYVRVEPPLSWGFETERFGYGIRSLPHKTKGEGFFLAVLRRRKERPKHLEKRKSGGLFHEPSREEVTWAKELAFSPSKETVVFNQSVYELAADRQFLESLASRTFIVEPGCAQYHLKGKWVEPAHSHALRADRTQEWPLLALDLEDAREYLRGSAIPNSTFKGWGIATYSGIPLGWVKGVQGRYNNAYPKEWRLRMR